MEAKHLNITIYGRVQGVFFRASTREKASELSIRGWVRNQPDGSVYVEAEGDPPSLDEFVDWCKQGPPMSKVEKVETERSEVVDYKGFEIR